MNDEKETKRRRRRTATATPSIGNKGNAVTATTTCDRDHHQGCDVTGGKRRSGRNRSYEITTSPVVMEEESIVSII